MPPPRRRALLAAFALLGLLIALFRLTDDSATSQQSPRVSSAQVDGNQLSVTFSERLSAQSRAVAADFTVKLGDAVQPIASAALDGTRIVLTLQRALPDVDCTDASVSVGYQPAQSTLAGVGGGEIGPIDQIDVDNVTDAPPQLVSLETNAAGTAVYAQFCEPIADLSFQWSTFDAFSLRADNAPLAVHDLIRSSRDHARLEIQIARNTPIREGQQVTLGYNQSLGNEFFPLADANQGKRLVASWAPRAVTNRVDVAPTLVKAAARYEVVTLTFSEDLDEASVPAAEAFRVGGIQHAPSVQSVAIAGRTVRLSLSAILSGGDTNYTLSYTAPVESPLRQRDGAHQVADLYSFTFRSNTPTARPQTVSAQVDGAMLTITFDLPLKNVAPASAFTLSGVNGVSVADTSFQGTVVTLMLSAAVPPGATITISYEQPNEPPRIEARNNRDAESFDSLSAANLTVAPAPQLQIAAVSADGSTLTLRFSLALDASEQGTPPTSAFMLRGTDAEITSVAVSGSTVSISLEPLADAGETITASYTPPPSASQPRLRSRNYPKPVEAFSSQAVINRADGKPRPTSAAVDGSLLVVMFDRMLDDTALPDASAFILAGSAAAPTAVSITGRSLSLTLSPAATHEDTATLSYSPPSESPLKRDGRSIPVDGFIALEVENQTSDPTPAFSSAQIDPTGRTLTITMSGPLLTTAAGTPAMAAFAITGSDQAVINSVTVRGSDIRLALSPSADVSETISVSYTQPQNESDAALRSIDGRWRVSSWSNQPITNLADGIPRPVATSVNGAALTLQFDRPLESASIPPAADFTISPAGITADEIAIDGRTVSLTLSRAVVHNEVVMISYAAATAPILSRDGQPLSVNAFANLAVRNLTPQPLLVSVAGNERTIQVTFLKDLNADRVPEASAFSLGSDQPSVTNVSIDARTLRLTLDRALTEGAEYTLTYTAPSEAPLTTAGGDQVPAFSRAVVNNTDVPPSPLAAIGDVSTITITFDQTLDKNADVPASSFQLTAGTALEVSDIDIEGVTLTLTLSRTLREDETASLTYTPPAVDTAGGIADPGRHRTEQFSIQVDNRTDTAPIPISGTVEDNQIAIVLDQEIYADERFDLDVQPEGYPTEHFTLRGTDAAITFVEVVVNGPGGAGQIVITLSETVHPDDVISITYFPASGTVRIHDNDASEHRAQINNYQLNNITARPPQVVSAQVDGTTLTITFDLPLDAGTLPSISAFTLSVGESRPKSQCLDPTPHARGLPTLSTNSAQPVIQSISIDNATLTLTLDRSVLEDDDNITLTYVSSETSAFTGVNGLPVPAVDDLVLVNLTDYAPTPISLCATTADGHLDIEFHVLFDQRLDPAGTIDTAWFMTEPYTDIRSVILVSVDGEERKLGFILEPHTPVREGQELTLTYSAPTSGGLRDDDVGHPVASFSKKVNNNVDVAPRVEAIRAKNNMITVEFDQEIDDEHVPPANCKMLEDMIAGFTCDKYLDLQWFTVIDADGAKIAVETVAVDAVVVTLKLLRRLLPNERISINYIGKSVRDGMYNLRDTSTPSNHVEGFTHNNIVSESAARPVTATLSRTSPDLVIIEFDGALPPAANSDHSGLSVSAGGVPISILVASTTQSTMTLRLAAAVSECAAAVVAYDMTNGALVDAANHPIESFTMAIANLIDREWALQCVRVDMGNIILSFDNEGGTPKRSGYQWRLSVNGSPRRFTLNESSGNIELRPTEPICTGDYIEVRYIGPESSAQLVFNRLIEKSAPCAIGAWVSQLQLSVAFDSALDNTLPSASEFSINGDTEVEAVERIDGSRLELRLAPPGIHVRQSGRLRYTGTTLAGSDMAVAPFEIDVIDETAPPRLISASAIGAHVMLRFDQPLSDVNIPASRFVLAVTEVSISVQSTEVQGATLILTLSRDLPDEPDILPVAYLAGTRGGVAGLTGVRVPDGIFVVRNLTETRPSVVSITAETRTVRIGFDQRIDGAQALASDFTVMAGLRTIPVASMSWANDAVTLTLMERITSLDVVLVSYQPGTGGAVRDRSGLALKAFEIPADNQTPRPRSTADKVTDARLRARGSATLLARELAWEFASTDGMNFILERGTGETAVIQGEIRLTIDVAQFSEEAMRISLRRMSNLQPILEHLDAVPRRCWHADAQSDIDGLLFDLTDLRKLPLAERLQMSLGGQEVVRVPGWCVLDLVTGRWSLMPFDGAISVPSLLIERPILELIEPFGGADGA